MLPYLLDHNNKRTIDIPILGTTASLTAGQPLADRVPELVYASVWCKPVIKTLRYIGLYIDLNTRLLQ